MFNPFKRKPRVTVHNHTFNVEITDKQLIEAHEKRVTELLNYNSAQLQENRDLKKVLRLAAEAAGQNDIGACRALLGAFA